MPRCTWSFHANNVALQEWMMYHRKPHHQLLTWQRTFTLVNGHPIWDEDYGKYDEREKAIPTLPATPRLPSCSPSRPKPHRGAPSQKQPQSPQRPNRPHVPLSARSFGSSWMQSNGPTLSGATSSGLTTSSPNPAPNGRTIFRQRTCADLCL